MPPIDEHAEEIAGLCAAVAALAIALDQAGSLPTVRYRETLERLWLALPEIDAVGGAGAAIERVLTHLPITGPPRRDAPAATPPMTVVAGGAAVKAQAQARSA